jgi:hypothetical protein
MKTMSSAGIGMALTMTALVVGAVPLLAAESPVTVTGHLLRVRPADQRLTLQTTEGSDLELRVGAHSQLMHHKHQARLSEFKAGTRVRVTYEPVEGVNRVIALRDAPVTTAELQREFHDALESAKQYTYQQKEQYQKQLQPVLHDLDDRIEYLKEQAKGAGKQAQQWYAQSIQELERERAKVGKQLAKAQAAAPGAWNEVKSGVTAAWGDLQRAFQRAGERLKEGESSNQPPPV